MLPVSTEEVAMESAVSVKKPEFKHSDPDLKKYFKYKLK